ncbi:MAG TPA: tetratricopeptide repeat protein [Longimicrobium sp.]|nr:tetratricopeptide repeat protein [Longimicrobium sp.]
MHWERALPNPSGAPAGVIVLEAERGRSRRLALTEWTAAAAEGGASAWLLPCDFDENGPWAGVDALVEGLLPALDAHAPDLLEAHAIELATVHPPLRPRLAPPKSLTDLAVGAEAVRNYAVDRAHRISAGVVDLLDAWQRRRPAPRWVLVADDFDRAGALVRGFCREVARRRGEALNLTLVVAVEPGRGEEALQALRLAAPALAVRLELPADAERLSPAEARARAETLEAEVGTDLRMRDHLFPRLVRLWAESDTPERGYRWEALALGRLNHHGYYEDALRYAPAVLAHLDAAATGEGYFTRWNLVGSIFGCLAAAGRMDEAHRVVKEEALEKISAPGDRARVCYIMAMLHARFLPVKDQRKADLYLAEALRLIEDPSLAPEDRHFLHVFLNNGLALVRHRQGRPQEAIDLCQSGFDEITEHLTGERHRLHRSVLLYNIAQVYTSMGESERAISYYSAAMEMDPNYSEYYNDRGGEHMRMGRFEEALADYFEAVRLSPPYQEVWTNLGQCYRSMGRLDDALAAYSRALDLEPGAKVARVGRAQVLDFVGRKDEALADYDAALAADPAQPLVLANRAVLHYTAGRLDASLADLDRAVSLAPENPALYRNRAVALADLGRADEAARDLRTSLELAPGAPDRAQVEARIAALEGELATA